MDCASNLGELWMMLSAKASLILIRKINKNKKKMVGNKINKIK